MSAPQSSFPSISIAAPVVLTAVMFGALGLIVRNLRAFKVYGLGWVIAYTILRTVAFLMRIGVAKHPEDSLDDINNKITLLIVDSVFYTAGYFFLFNCVLSLTIRFLGPLATRPQPGTRAATESRILRYCHLAIITASALSIYGGVKMSSLPHTSALTPADLDVQAKSKTYRQVGVYLMLAVVAAVGMLLATKVARHEGPRRPGVYLLVTLVFLAVRAGLSLFFIENPDKMVDEKYLYGLAIAPELPALLLLCVPHCVAWFTYAPEVQAAHGAYSWLPTTIKNRLDKYNPNWNAPPRPSAELGYPMNSRAPAYKPFPPEQQQQQQQQHHHSAAGSTETVY
ncbi:hypothetical protein HDU86_006395 [Geranomyces michiganensis]|nr:hypothetical protein HDU86_006395 [Geranomyces michiganensis]